MLYLSASVKNLSFFHFVDSEMFNCNKKYLRNKRAILLCMTLFCNDLFAIQRASDKEPIAFIGHGSMFDQYGNEVTPSITFIRSAQEWYMGSLIGKISKNQRTEFKKLERSLLKGLDKNEQTRLIVNSYLLDWLINTAQIDNRNRILGKNNLIKLRLKTKLRISADSSPPKSPEPFNVSPDILSGLNSALKKFPQPEKFVPKLVTDVGGTAYRELCKSRGVPLPPDFGPGSAWVPRAVTGNPDGIIDKKNLFIVRDLDAQVLTYQSTSPVGMCVALPRYDTANQVQADGVICLGQQDPQEPSRAKACFWDNQDPTVPIDSSPTAPSPTFTFTRGEFQAISRFAGGSELRAGVGGVCSDCHSGENPYIIHGEVLESLSEVSGVLPALPTFAPTWYGPIIRSGDIQQWPQNPGPIVAPASCVSCHSQGDAGRFPYLSNDIPGYCRAVLRSAIGALAPPLPSTTNPPASMPPGRKAGSLACTPGLPPADPRYRACSAETTVSCTPGFRENDPRLKEPDYPAAYQVACTPEIASLLNTCNTAN